MRCWTLRFLTAFAAITSLGHCLSVSKNQPSFVILGGTGRIGTAVASHLLLRKPDAQIILAGRNEKKGQRAVKEVLQTFTKDASVEWQYLSSVWDAAALEPLVQNADCVIHTAGPYLNQEPIPLQVALRSSRCKAYVDVSDPLDYLESSLELTKEAQSKGCTALIASGAFPGMSNVLAVEAAAACDAAIRDVRFNFFTAGLGGSGDVNLYITNLGFGEPMAQYDDGKLRLWQALSGRLLGQVSFYLDDEESQEAEKRVGRQTVFSWPFPEAATVPRHLKASGSSSAAMGTSPPIWNTMLGILVDIIPRSWWRSEAFSQFMADFSEPLVKLTDSFFVDGETHGMRVDVTAEDGKAVSIVQAHDSFRQCVGQSCAEFALDALENPKPGVYLPEQFYNDAEARQQIIERLTSTPGTFCYTGPVKVPEAPAPSNLEETLREANDAEQTPSNA